MNNYATNVVNNSRPFTELPERFMHTIKAMAAGQSSIVGQLEVFNKGYLVSRL